MSQIDRKGIEYLSQAAPVNMGDQWFEIANLEHFWIKRRFEVLRKLLPDFPASGMKVGEVGCGTGLFQRQCEDGFEIQVDGFDLNESALRQSVVRRSRIFRYNVFDREPALRALYDVLFLFDVLEHIEDEGAFLEAVLFHLKPNGTLVVNVPADQRLFSAYDKAVGHVRRYSLKELAGKLEALGFHTVAQTYWGIPLTPLLFIRKWLLDRRTDKSDLLKTGFEPPSALANTALWLLSQCEMLPQKWWGSSLMVAASKR